MRIKVLGFIIFLVMFAILPFITLKDNGIRDNNTQKNTSTSPASTNTSNTQKSSESATAKSKEITTEDILSGITAANCKANFGERTIEAVAMLMCSNYTYDKNKFDIDDTSQCVFENDADENLLKIYPKIRSAVNKYKNTKITYNEKNVFIPWFYVSDGVTQTDESYEYLSAVASPWDCFSDDNSSKESYTGVSVYGLNYLCNNSYSAKNALKWYLPELEINT